MRCRTCGRNNRPDAVFCDVCGARLTRFANNKQPSLAVGTAPDGVAEAALRPEPPRTPDQWAEAVFVGRESEMETLRAGLEDTLAGRGRLVMLVGDPGIGKTRTAQELAGYAVDRGARVLWGRCYETPGAPPFWPWGQVPRTYVRGREAEALRGEMGAGAADIAEIVPEVREQLSGLPPAPPLQIPSRRASGCSTPSPPFSAARPNTKPWSWSWTICTGRISHLCCCWSSWHASWCRVVS